jgi:ribosomal protein S24E
MEYIILKWCGVWVLHESPATYSSQEAAESEAAEINTETIVVSVTEIAEFFGERCSP